MQTFMSIPSIEFNCSQSMEVWNNAQWSPNVRVLLIWVTNMHLPIHTPKYRAHPEQAVYWVLSSNTDYKFMQGGCQCLSSKRLEEGRRTALQQRHVPAQCAIVSIGDTAQEERGCTFHSYTGSVVGGPDLLRRLFIYICDHSTWIIKSTDKTGAYGEDLQCVSSQAPSWCDHNVAKPGIRHKNGRMYLSGFVTLKYKGGGC